MEPRTSSKAAPGSWPRCRWASSAPSSRTLSLRDKMTARHSAAVARYAREIAREHGCSASEQDLVHTAALLHDIGKFIFPDSILFAAPLTEDELEIVRRHPEQGARLVARIEGYGPVAEIILAHHERIDGKGYPNGLLGRGDPALSRIIAVADTYDVMTRATPTAGPSPRGRRSRSCGASPARSLDGGGGRDLHGAARALVTFRHADDADFERELNLERRIREYAQPRDRVSRRHLSDSGPAGEAEITDSERPERRWRLRARLSA